MFTVLHGDNTVASRNQLNALITQHKSRGVKDTIRLDGKTITPTDLIQALETQSLFGTDRLVIIEDLLTRPKSKTKTDLAAYLKTISSQPNIPSIIIWEQKPLTTPQLKSLGNPPHQVYKLSKKLWNFLDSLKPQNSKQSLQLLHQTLDQEAPEMVFAMLVRQVRLLIQTKDNTKLKIAPWQINKLKNQASHFSLQQLLNLHKQLLTLDHQTKTGQNLLTLSSSLDILVTNL